MIKIDRNKHRYKSIIKTDRYGITYVKNFMISAYGSISMQYWTSENTRVKHKLLKVL